MAQNDETELIKQAQNGDARAFEDLVNRYYDMMFKVAYKWCGNQENAEDIAQEACIKLARGLDSFKHDSIFTTWLYRIVVNAAKDWFKKQNRHKGSAEALETLSVQSTAESQLHAKDVLAEVHKLPEGERDALLLVVMEGLTHKEAADILECKESTISWRIHEARKKLETRFGKEQKYG